MKSPGLRFVAIFLLVVAVRGDIGRADVAVPPSILSPKNPAEAWNVIRLATKNVDALLEENRLPEIPVQISLCSPALRFLASSPPSAEEAAQVEAKVGQAMISVLAIARAAQDKNGGGVRSALDSLSAKLDEVAQHFDPKVVGAEIFLCPMHADFLSDDLKTPCAKCGMDLLKRRIPYSFIYTKPGEPSLRMTASANAPIQAGRKVEVTVKFAKADQSPVRYADLLLMHDEYIHLLIEEPSLADYHHEHPVATKTPGEYVFSFIPKKTAPYRMWADLVPSATGIQELPFVDLPSAGKPEPITNTTNCFESVAGGYQFALALADGNHVPAKAGQARRMAITVTAPDGKPVTTLQPVMNAFVHLVGFYDDFKTVVHLHPEGGDVLDPDRRGGPTLSFLFFPPRSGFIRLYCQVMIDRQMLFAPFNLNVVE